MRHRATSSFWRQYSTLPEEVQELATKSFELLKQDSWHPSLHLKKVNDVWPVRIGLRYRALAYEEESDLWWFWIGHHTEYESALNTFVPRKVRSNPACMELSATWHL